MRAAGASAAIPLSQLLLLPTLQPSFFAPRILQHPTLGLSALPENPFKDRQFSKCRKLFFLSVLRNSQALEGHVLSEVL